MNDYKTLLAHNDKLDVNKRQFLLTHLLEVAKKSSVMGDSVALKNSCELIGLLHDFGKSSELFQMYIKGQYSGKVNHSSAGAKVLVHISKVVKEEYGVCEILEDNGQGIRAWYLYREILQYPILAHHGLYDIIDSDFDYRTELRLDYDKDGGYDFKGSGMNFFSYLNDEYSILTGKSIYKLYFEGFIEFLDIYDKLKKMADKFSEKKYKAKAISFYYGALVRLLLSILKDADIYDASNYHKMHKDKAYTQEELNKVWEQMEYSVEEIYDKFENKPNKSKLDMVRTSLANDVYEFSKEAGSGAYKLSMNVGSGKTYAALRYSITNAAKFQKTRIFYCTAFLSVLEQNADVIKELLGDSYVLEHHSNITENFEKSGDDIDEIEYSDYEYLKESWESPVILTTIVQLSNTLFKGKSSNIRRFSKLINSVIIMDEIQSLPMMAIYNFNLMTNFLTNIMNCNVLHCTATPPSFDNNQALKYPCFYGNESMGASVIDSTDNLEVFDRTDYYSLLGGDLLMELDTKDIIDNLKEQLENENSALIVLNTKGAVSSLYNRLLEEDWIEDMECEVIYLTTNQCPNHRLEIIKNMGFYLEELRAGRENKKLICVSTKLIEAGVDIDFDLVYRSLSGIDSIIQSGGRCNREGKKNSKGKVFIFKYCEENLSYMPDLRKQRSAAESALRTLIKNSKDSFKVDIDKACDHYFHKLFCNEEIEGNYLEYPLDQKNTILDLLTTNPIGMKNYRNKYDEKPHFILKQGFKTASTNFDLIKQDSISVIVQYNNDKLMDLLYESIEYGNYSTIKTVLKKLQPYTIDIRDISAYEKYVTPQLNGEILILNKEAYDEKVGLIKGELQLLVY